MKKLYSFILFASFGLTALAETDSNYYWFYNKVEAAPTGKGLIYASTENVAPTSDADYQASMELKNYAQGASFTILSVWAQPAAGYQFAGWYTASDEEITYADLVAEGDSTTITAYTTQSTEDDTVENYNLEGPDNTYQGVFSKVKIGYVPGQNSVGTLEISKVANDTGDKVYILAQPNDEVTTKFDYWTDSKGNKIYQNPYEFTVGDIETYTAHFSGDSIITFDFGQSGTKYIPFSSQFGGTMAPGMTATRVTPVEKMFYDDSYNQITFDESENAWGYWEYTYDDDYNITSSTFHKYEGEIPSFDTSYELTSFGYNYTATDGVLLSGKGEMSIVLHAEADPYLTDNFLKGTADGPVDIASLPQTDEEGNAITYYTFNGKSFVKATSGTVAQGQCYMALDATQYPLEDKFVVVEGGDDEEPATVVGDLDGDGRVTVGDITLLIDVYLNSSTR